MKRIYCLRKRGTEEIVIAVASSVHNAKYLAGGDHQDWAYLADCSIQNFSANEKKHMDDWKKQAGKAWFKEKI